MNLSDALRSINDNHPDGAVEFYAKMKDDPWQKAHDSLDISIREKTFEPGVAVQAFYAEIRRLQDLFRQSGVSQKAHPANVGFYAPTEREGSRRMAVQERYCVVCGTTKSLTFVRVEGKPTPCCESCVLKLQADPQMPLF